MELNNFCDLTTAESRAKIWCQEKALSSLVTLAAAHARIQKVLSEGAQI